MEGFAAALKFVARAIEWARVSTQDIIGEWDGDKWRWTFTYPNGLDIEAGRVAWEAWEKAKKRPFYRDFVAK